VVVAKEETTSERNATSWRVVLARGRIARIKDHERRDARAPEDHEAPRARASEDYSAAAVLTTGRSGGLTDGHHRAAFTRYRPTAIHEWSSGLHREDIRTPNTGARNEPTSRPEYTKPEDLARGAGRRGRWHDHVTRTEW